MRRSSKPGGDRPEGRSGGRRRTGRSGPLMATGAPALMAHGFLIMLCVTVIIPFLMIIFGSMTSEQALSLSGARPYLNHFSGAAWTYAFKYPGPIIRSYAVTAFVTVVGTVVSVTLTTMLAYVISRRDFAMARVTTFIVLFTLLFNGGLVPFFILISDYMHLDNTVWAMIVPGLATPFMVLIAKGYLSRMSYEVIEAAKMDGASEYRTFFQIVIPMMKPALATMSVLIAFSYWGEYFNALLFISNPKLYPLQFYIYNLGTELSFLTQNPTVAQQLLGLKSVASIPFISAQFVFTILAVAPFIIVFAFLQRYFREGLTVGSFKG